MSDGNRCEDRESDDGGRDRRDSRECDLCGESVPRAVYREHLLKSCSGR